MSTKNIYFRPKARHIFTIWRDLIKDNFSALIELVKNSYDADASKVVITFEKIENDKIKIIISDDWSGMSEETIRSVRFVPSTDIKKANKTSQSWRVYQWKKGIWRYAAATLWDQFKLATIKDGVLSEVEMSWNIFNSDKFLDEIPLVITTKKTSEKNWTTIEIIWDKNELLFWEGNTKKWEKLFSDFDGSDNFQKLKTELKKLIPPFKSHSWFSIWLKYNKKETMIEQNNPIEFFDYKISWKVDNNWNVEYLYKNADIGEDIKGKCSINLSKENEGFWSLNYPGSVEFEFFVFDWDPIEERSKISSVHWRHVVNRGEWKELFKKFSGVSIFREGFRIRPYGDPWEDRLWLNARRVNNPSLRLSANQVIGYVTIKSEEESNLIEASSRERLKENSYYSWLILELRKILSILEEKRFQYRQTRKTKKKKLINFDEEINQIKNKVKKIESDADKEAVIWDVDQLGNKFEEEKKRLEKIIYQYEWQVTLWKIMFIMFHELEKPIKFIRDNIKNVDFYFKKLKDLPSTIEKEKLLNLLGHYKTNSTIISDFLSKNLRPLIKRSTKPVEFDLIKVLDNCFQVFSTVCKDNNISVRINNFLGGKLFVFWYDTDFIIAITNFIDNSIYWLNYKWGDKKYIMIDLFTYDSNLVLLFKDNGFWISGLENKDDILEPGFSKKDMGTWLGLSIAWEVLERNNSTLEILDSDWDFTFILKVTIKKWSQKQ